MSRPTLTDMKEEAARLRRLMPEERQREFEEREVAGMSFGDEVEDSIEGLAQLAWQLYWHHIKSVLYSVPL